MTELERLKRRRDAWAGLTGPRWMLNYKQKTIDELDEQIRKLEGEQ